MGEFNESKRSLSGMEKLSLETNRIPRDLLHRLVARNPSQLAATGMKKEEEGEDSEEIELNLGLSLGGRFGVDRSCEKKKLMRSSSIAGSIPVVRDYDAVARRPPVSYPTLIRTSSLPVETGEEWRKRKELQTLRRMEAKRRRTEKQRISQACAAAQNAILAGRRGNHMGGGGCGGSCNQGFLQPVGSMESQGGSSSGMSESESRPVQGTAFSLFEQVVFV